MKPVGEPDAGNPPVRFDEREVETEHGMRLVRHRRGNPDPDYAEAYPTAPPLDSTLFSPIKIRRTVQGSFTWTTLSITQMAAVRPRAMTWHTGWPMMGDSSSMFPAIEDR